MTGEQLREILKEKGYSLSKIAELLDITPQTLNSRLRAKTIKDEYIREIEEVTGNIITHNRGSINTGTVVGSIVTGSNNNLGDKDAQIILLENENKYLKEMLAEKERFIQTLLNK